jgi:hypothetical protein
MEMAGDILPRSREGGKGRPGHMLFPIEDSATLIQLLGAAFYCWRGWALKKDTIASWQHGQRDPAVSSTAPLVCSIAAQ